MIKILCNLKQIKEKAEYPIGSYIDYLENQGLKPNLLDRPYDPVYTERLSRLLMKQKQKNIDPDKIIRQNIPEGQVFADPYEYYNPEDVSGAWLTKQRERKQSIDIGNMSLPDILQTGRDWGSRFLPIIDKLSDGYEMRKLTDEKSMIDAGKDLSVCIGVSSGATERQEALTGHQEIWGLFNPSNQCVAMATVRIDEMKGVRYIKEIRGYKNEGFRHHGYGDYIDEWLSLHPDYYYTGRMKKGTEYDTRGFWEDAYLDQDDVDGDSLLAELVQNDIGELDRLFDDVSLDFKRTLLFSIVKNIDDLKRSTVQKYFRELPELIDDALRVPIENQRNHISLLVTLSEMEDIDITDYILNLFKSSWSNYNFDINDVSDLLDIYSVRNPDFLNKIIEIGKRDAINDLSGDFKNQPINLAKLACFKFNSEEECSVVFNIIVSKIENMIDSNIDFKNNLTYGNNLNNLIEAFEIFRNKIVDKNFKISKSVDLFGKMFDKGLYWQLPLFFDNEILGSDNLFNMMKDKIESSQDKSKLLKLSELTIFIISKLENSGNKSEIAGEYLQSIDTFIGKFENSKNDVVYDDIKWNFVDLYNRFILSPEYISKINDSFIKYDPDFVVSYEYLNQLLNPRSFTDSKAKTKYYMSLKQDIIKIINILKQKGIDVIEYFNHLKTKSLAVLYYLGFIDSNPRIMEQVRSYDLMDNNLKEAKIFQKMVKISNKIDSIAYDISDSIDLILRRFYV